MVSSILAKSLDAFARLDSESAIKVIEADKEIDNCYDDILQQRGASMREHPSQLDQSLNVMWSARALERIGDHSNNIGEYVVYLVKGRDVRHINAAAAVADD